MSDSSTFSVAPVVAVRLSGTGGQGLVLMGHLLADALALFEGLHVVQTKSYGPEARGGASRSDVIVSPGEIDDLGGLPLDLLVCLSQQACDKFCPALATSGLLIADSTNVAVVPTSRAIEVPLTETAIKVCGSAMVANVVALGVLAECTGVVRIESLRAAVEHSVKPAFQAMNHKALDAGVQLAQENRARRNAQHAGDVCDFSFLRQGKARAERPNGTSQPKRRKAGKVIAR